MLTVIAGFAVGMGIASLIRLAVKAIIAANGADMTSEDLE